MRFLFLGALFWASGTWGQADREAIVLSEYLYEEAPFPSCHASSIEETDHGLVAAWFGGSDEGEPDVGIWVARREGGKWTKPVEVANGLMAGGERHPTWNPVLWARAGGPLLLFYKVGPSPRQWWGMQMESSDGGKTWGPARRLPEGILGPIKNKPVQLADGKLLCGSSTEHEGWKVHVEWTPDLGQTWEKSGPLNDPATFGAIQPTILDWPGSGIQMLCRSRQGKVTELWSEDDGRSWAAMKAIDLPNPNSGLDAVLLRDGRALLVYNHTPKGRSPLNVALSKDGREWRQVLALETEPGEYSYPAVMQGKGGRVHVTYTWKRQRIRHVVLDPAKL